MKNRSFRLIVRQVLLALLVSLLNINIASAGKAAKIIGGSEVLFGEFAWTVALVSPGSNNYYDQFCGGTLIAPQWVVTAAHCTDGERPGNIEVLIGGYDLAADEGYRSSVDLIIMHRNFNRFTLDSDIALLKLSAAIDETPISGLIRPGDPEKLSGPFTEATVLGWGDTTGYGRYSEVLLSATVVILPQRFGVRAYGPNDFTRNMLVAGDRENRNDSCSGDSGGPIVVPSDDGLNWSLAGITSWGDGCAVPGSPGVYTRVSRFVPWIEFIMSKF